MIIRSLHRNDLGTFAVGEVASIVLREIILIFIGVHV